MNTVKKEYEAPQVTPLELKSGLNILVQFSTEGNIDEIVVGEDEG